MDLFSDGVRVRVINLNLEDLAIGRELSLRDTHLLPLKPHDPDRVTTIDFFDPHRLSRRLTLDQHRNVLAVELRQDGRVDGAPVHPGRQSSR